MNFNWSLICRHSVRGPTGNRIVWRISSHTCPSTVYSEWGTSRRRYQDTPAAYVPGVGDKKSSYVISPGNII